jgi:photosystem II stability/assembly factor-like uncharacterized protein
MNIFLPLLFLFLALQTAAQPQPTPAAKRMDAVQQRTRLDEQSLINTVPFRNIGPRIMSGRVVDIAVNPDKSTEFYVAFASGGLWYTSSNGQSFTPVFDREAVMTIGAIAVRWKNDKTHEVWVGTGEVNSSRSSYSGAGVYKSMDAGTTWTNLGLPESHHIGTIVLDPAEPGTAWVAALGHLYSANTERGVYKTNDGGSTWKQALFIDDNTGCVQLQMDPSNNKILYANMWYRTRRAWNFEESGKTSGIYKSMDGGGSWKKISGEGSGLPDGKGFGRSGIAIYSKDPSVLYCIVDNQDHRVLKEEKNAEELTPEYMDKLTADEFLKLDDGKLNAYLVAKDFPKMYNAFSVKELIRNKKATVHDIVAYTDDANTLLFRTPIIGAEVYRSNDGGAHWTKQNAAYLDFVFNTYGYYFGQIVVSPADDKKVFTFGVPLLKSATAGATWTSIDGDNVHGDFHVLWVDPRDPQHLICGNDGGVNISYDEGAHWIKCNSIPVAQCYSVNADNADHYNVYAGLQDNNVWTGPHSGDESTSWHQEGEYSFKALIGGDGMQVQIDSRDNNTVYTGYQFGNYFRINKTTGQTKPLQIEEYIGEEKLRWNWNTPILLSHHSQDIVYWGSNKLHRSLDQGETWKTISGDLTGGKRDGDIAYATLTSIDESPLQFGLIYTGSDDGKVNVTKNGGSSWNEVGNKIGTQLNIPSGLWVSRVIASKHKPGRVFVTLNGYRNDHFDAYVFKSEDYGETWLNLTNNLPAEPVNVVREDPSNERLLYLGTDYGVYISLDGGSAWMRWSNGIPNVAVHDMVVQARDKELVVGTHGRSIFIADISAVQQLNDKAMDASVKVFNANRYRLPRGLGRKGSAYSTRTKPALEIYYYAKQAGTTKVELLDTARKKVLHTQLEVTKPGLNIFKYDYTIDKPIDPKASKAEDGSYYIPKGLYVIRMSQGNAKDERTIEFTDK